MREAHKRVVTLRFCTDWPETAIHIYFKGLHFFAPPFLFFPAQIRIFFAFSPLLAVSDLPVWIRQRHLKIECEQGSNSLQTCPPVISQYSSILLKRQGVQLNAHLDLVLHQSCSCHSFQRAGRAAAASQIELQANHV